MRKFSLGTIILVYIVSWFLTMLSKPVISLQDGTLAISSDIEIPSLFNVLGLIGLAFLCIYGVLMDGDKEPGVTLK